MLLNLLIKQTLGKHRLVLRVHLVFISQCLF